MQREVAAGAKRARPQFHNYHTVSPYVPFLSRCGVAFGWSNLPDLNTAEAVALDVVGNGLVSARSAEGSTRGSQPQLYNTKKHTCKANWGGFEPSYMSTCLINRENVDHAPAIPLFPPSFSSTSCDFRHLALPEHHSLLLFRPPQRTGV